ncbi:MAG: alpha/beta hydrolase [Rhodospirillaceae bacterium]|nr:alpha/beta hydrolase [Rhodospirillaceae bacterium]
MGGYDQGLILARALFGEVNNTRVVAVSRPGYLGSPLEGHSGADSQADLYAALLDERGISQVVVAAVSAGGPSALQFAARHPARCRGVILISAATGGLTVPPEVAARMRKMRVFARMPGFTRLLRWQAGRNPSRTAARSVRDPALRERTLGHPQAGKLMRELQGSVMDGFARRLPGTLNDMAEGAAPLDNAIRAIRCPILAVHGTADSIVPFAHAERIARENPRGAVMAVEGGEHVVIFTHLDMIRGRVGAFLEAVS